MDDTSALSSTAGTVIIRSSSRGHSSPLQSDADQQATTPWRQANRPLRDLFTPLSIEEMFTKPPTTAAAPNSTTSMAADKSFLYDDDDDSQHNSDYQAFDDAGPVQSSFYLQPGSNQGPPGYLEDVSQIVPTDDIGGFDDSRDGEGNEMLLVGQDIAHESTFSAAAAAVDTTTSSDVTPRVDMQSFRMRVTAGTAESALGQVQSFDVSVLVMGDEEGAENRSIARLDADNQAHDEHPHTAELSRLSSRLIAADIAEQASESSPVQTAAHSNADSTASLSDADEISTARNQVESSNEQAGQFAQNVGEIYFAPPVAQSPLRASNTPKQRCSGRAASRTVHRKNTPRLSRSLSPAKLLSVEHRGLPPGKGTAKLISPTKSLTLQQSDGNQENTVKLFRLHYDTSTRDRLSALISELDCADIGAISALEDNDGLSVGMKRLKLSEASFRVDPDEQESAAQAPLQIQPEKSIADDLQSKPDSEASFAESFTDLNSREPDAERHSPGFTKQEIPAATNLASIASADISRPRFARQMMKALASVEAAMDEAPMLSTVMEDSREAEEMHAAIHRHSSNLSRSTSDCHQPTAEGTELGLIVERTEPLFGGTTDKLPPATSRSISSGSTDTAIRIVAHAVSPRSSAPVHLIKPEDLENQIPQQMGSMVFDAGRGLWLRQAPSAEMDDPFHALSEEEDAKAGSVKIEPECTADDETDNEEYGSESEQYTYDHTLANEQSMYENEKLAYYYNALKELKTAAESTLGIGPLNSRAGTSEVRSESPLESVKRLMQLLGLEATADALHSVNLRDKQLDSVYGLSDICSQLKSLDISNNQVRFLGGVPSSLEQLIACNNQLTNDAQFEHLAHLRILDISSNPITELQCITALHGLRQLVADRCRIADIPKQFSAFSNVYRLSLRSNCITNFSFASLLPNVETIDLGCNQLKRVHIADGNLPKLRILILDQNQIEMFCSSDRSASDLQLLDVSSNKLTVLPSLPSLVTLSVSDNSLDGNCFHKMCNMPSLKELCLQNCNMSVLHGRLLAAKCTILERLDLSCNQLSDLDGLRRMQRLTSLLLGGNQISSWSQCVRGIKRLQSLQALDLSKNALTNSFYPANSTDAPPPSVELSDAAYVQRQLYRSALIRLLPQLQQLDRIDVTDRDRKLATIQYTKIKERLTSASARNPTTLPKSSSVKFWIDAKNNSISPSLPQFERRLPVAPTAKTLHSIAKRAVPQPQNRTHLPARSTPKRGETRCFVYSADGKPMALERRA